jgi:uroporphyrinogen decarboxylase
MSELTHRERVLLAFDHQEPDRVPIDFMGNASMVLDDTYFRLRDYLGITGDIEPVREGTTANYYDERILEKFDIDFRRVFLPTLPGIYRYHADGTFTDPWGMVWQKSGIYVNCIHSPLADADIDQVADYAWPDPTQVWHTQGVQAKARHLYENTDYALVARNPVTWGFVDLGCRMRGMEQFLMDLVINPDIAQLIIARSLAIFMQVYDMFLQAVGPFVHVVETADDLGTQNSLLISPTTYRQLIKPAQEKLNGLIKDRAQQARIFMHNDGAITKIIPDLIEIGVEILNPIQPSAKGMESEQLKQEFGDQLIFHGAVDQKPQEGTEGDIRAEVRRRIDALGPGGGYVLSTSNVIVDPPLENIVALFDEAREYGRYPIRSIKSV